MNLSAKKRTFIMSTEAIIEKSLHSVLLTLMDVTLDSHRGNKKVHGCPRCGVDERYNILTLIENIHVHVAL